jgi:hypothetical protein
MAHKPSVFRTINNNEVDVVKLSGNPLKQSLPSLIGISYDIFSNRLDVYNDDSANIVVNSDNVQEYLDKSIDELAAEAKPYWDKIENMPKEWYEKYDMSEELKRLQHDAVKRTYEFGHYNV